MAGLLIVFSRADLAKMLRRRADLREVVLADLSLQHYLLATRQLRFELGEIFSDLMHL